MADDRAIRIPVDIDDKAAQKELPDRVKALMEETYKRNAELIAK